MAERDSGTRFYDNGHLQGFIAGDIDVRYLPDGRPVANFSIPIGGRWKDGGKVDATIWCNVSAFGKTAEDVIEWADKGLLGKGSLVSVQGQFQADTYNGKEKLRLLASSISLIVKARMVPGRPTGAAKQPPSEDMPF